MQASDKKRILILGGGFGGVAAAQQLTKRLRGSTEAEVTLIDRTNYQVFHPLLASAASGAVDILHIAPPLRRLVPKARIREEEILGVDLRRRTVTTRSHVTGRESLLAFDHLVMGLGNVINLSSLPGLAQHGKTMKSLGDALHLRNHVIAMLEAADIETDPRSRQEMLTFVVAGAGFSGVETIGELNDFVHDLRKSYPSIQKDNLKLILIHSGERILPEMPESLAAFALKKLRERGVEVRLQSRIAAATPREAILKSGERIATRTLVTTVGNSPNPVLAPLTELAREKGRLITDPYMAIAGLPGLWAVGDCAAIPNVSADGQYSPPTAQYALRQGKRLADNLYAELRGQPQQRKAFAFPGLGQLCLVGHKAGVAELFGGVKLSGFVAWVMWRNIYLSKLPSWDRKVRVGMNWGLDLVLPRDMSQLNLSRTQAITQAHYEPGDYIFRQGDVGDEFYVVISGQVEIFREKGSQQVPIAQLGPGEHFGESALLQGQRRSASARATGPVDLLLLGRDDFNSLAGTWLKFTESLKSLSEERANDPAFASRLLEFSQDFRTVFASGLLGHLPAAPPPPAPLPLPNAGSGRAPAPLPFPTNGSAGPVAPVAFRYTDAPPPIPFQRPASSPAPVPGYPATPVLTPNLLARPRLVRPDGAELLLNMHEMKLGRSAESHIVLADKQASRHHALLTRQGGSYLISDQQTSNGTFVNEQTITTHLLRDGDKIRVGASEFVYRIT